MEMLTPAVRLSMPGESDATPLHQAAGTDPKP